MTSQQAISAARRMQATAKAAQEQFAELRALYDALTVDDLDVIDATVSADMQVALMLLIMETHVGCSEIIDELRTINVIATQAIRKTTRIYRVQPGDTLESIAQVQLGSRSRALDLGVPQSALIVGKLIRIPEAS